MYLLDTNICIALLNENRQVVTQFNRVFPQCYTSTIVFAELYKGVYRSRQIQANINRLAELAELLAIEFFDLAAAEEFGRIQGELKQIGKPTGEVDVFIASVAHSRQDILITNNIRDFENIANLQLENWLEL